MKICNCSLSNQFFLASQENVVCQQWRKNFRADAYFQGQCQHGHLEKFGELEEAYDFHTITVTHASFKKENLEKAPA